MEESFSNGEKYSMRAEVGLLSRNVKIIGAVYPNMFSDSYGARVLVGVTADPTRRYTGTLNYIALCVHLVFTLCSSSVHLVLIL